MDVRVRATAELHVFGCVLSWMKNELMNMWWLDSMPLTCYTRIDAANSYAYILDNRPIWQNRLWWLIKIQNRCILTNFVSIVCMWAIVYCIRYIFRESDFSRIGTSRHFHEWLNSRSRRSTQVAFMRPDRR